MSELDDAKLKKLKSLLSLVSEGITEEKFLSSFKNVVNQILRLEKALIEKINVKLTDFEKIFNKLKDDLRQSDEDKKEQARLKIEYYCREMDERFNKALEEQANTLNFIRDKVRKIKEGKDGKDADETKILEILEKKIPTIEEWQASIPASGEAIRDSLELLQGDNRLEMSAIKDLKELLEEIKQTKTQRLGGGGGFNYGAMQLHFLPWTETSVAPNGILTDFVIGYSPNPISSLEVMVDNSPLFETSDWTYAPATKTISFLVAPPNGAKIRYKCLI